MSQNERFLERLRQHCLAKPGTSEEMPFGDVPWPMFIDLVDHSYALVWRGLTRKVKAAIEETQTR